MTRSFASPSSWPPRVAEYPAFQKCLAAICEPDAKVFKTFGKVLMQAHNMLRCYWSNLRAGEQSVFIRRETSREIIPDLDASGVNGKFYE